MEDDMRDAEQDSVVGRGPELQDIKLGNEPLYKTIIKDLKVAPNFDIESIKKIIYKPGKDGRKSKEVFKEIFPNATCMEDKDLSPEVIQSFNGVGVLIVNMDAVDLMPITVEGLKVYYTMTVKSVHDGSAINTSVTLGKIPPRWPCKPYLLNKSYSNGPGNQGCLSGAITSDRQQPPSVEDTHQDRNSIIHGNYNIINNGCCNYSCCLFRGGVMQTQNNVEGSVELSNNAMLR